LHCRIRFAKNNETFDSKTKGHIMSIATTDIHQKPPHIETLHFGSMLTSGFISRMAKRLHSHPSHCKSSCHTMAGILHNQHGICGSHFIQQSALTSTEDQRQHMPEMYNLKI
jgi:hypothetical protein